MDVPKDALRLTQVADGLCWMPDMDLKSAGWLHELFCHSLVSGAYSGVTFTRTYSSIGIGKGQHHYAAELGKWAKFWREAKS